MLVRFGMGVFAALALVVAGCGGSGSDSLTLDEFKTQADAICAQYDEKFSALGDPQTPAEAADLVREGKGIASDQLDELNALNAPDEVERQFSEAMDALQQEVDQFDDLAAALDDNDEAKSNEITAALGKLDAKADAVAQELGLEECGSST